MTAAEVQRLQADYLALNEELSAQREKVRRVEYRLAEVLRHLDLIPIMQLNWSTGQTSVVSAEHLAELRALLK